MSHHTYPRSFEPLQVGEVSLPSRIIFPGHRPGLNREGRVTDEYVEYHRARARGGAALQITGIQSVVPSGIDMPGSYGGVNNVDETVLPGLRRVADAVHNEGGKFLSQLGHMGVTASYSSRVAWGPSPIFSEETQQTATPMTDSDIREFVDGLNAAASRTVRASLDGVEIIMYAGTLIQQFLSPYSNRRNDTWGGTFDRRLALPLMILNEVRSTIGPTPILGVKLSVNEYIEGGIDLPEGLDIAGRLADSELIDYIQVMAGSNLAREGHKRDRQPAGTPHGEFREASRLVKQRVDVPVCYVGGVTSIDTAEDILSTGDADMVGMVRAQIADPNLVSKARHAEQARIRPCVHANECVRERPVGVPTWCAVNPFVGHEDNGTQYPSSSSGPDLPVAVIGGGPAGLEFARQLATNAVNVTIYDSKSDVGGMLNTWASSQRYNEFLKFPEWCKSELTRMNVPIHTSTPVTADHLMNTSEFDLVVDATGATPKQSQPTGAMSGQVQIISPNQLTEYSDGGRVAVIDKTGGLFPITIAAKLHDICDEVVLISEGLHPAEGVDSATLYPTLQYLGDANIVSLSQTHVEAVKGDSLILRGRLGRQTPPPVTGVTAIVTWAGTEPRDSSETIRSTTVNDRADIMVIGDAHAPGDVSAATSDARRAASAVLAQQSRR